MAVYDFYCQSCGEKIEVKLSFKEHDEQKNKIKCKKCNSTMTQEVAPLRFDLKGVGWFGKDGSGTGYEVTQRELDKNLNEESRFEDYAKKQMDKDKFNQK